MGSLRPAVLAVTLVVLMAAGPDVRVTDARADDPPLTHTTPLTPTGDIVQPGHVERVQALTAFYHQLAVGLGGGFELRAGFPGLPLPILGADVELRFAPLPPGRFALVLGGGGTAKFAGGADLWAGGSATVAWRERRWSLHATLRTSTHVDGDDRLALYTVGATLTSGTTLWFAEVGDMGYRARSTCTGYHGVEYACEDGGDGRGVWVGAWWRRKDLRGGISALVVRAGGLTLPILPLLGFAWDYRL